MHLSLVRICARVLPAVPLAVALAMATLDPKSGRAADCQLPLEIECHRAELLQLEAKLDGLLQDRLKAAHQAVDDVKRTRPDLAAEEAVAVYVAPLVTSQEAWLRYREAHCKAVASAAWPDGSGWGAFETGCRLALTRDRIRHVEELP